MTKILLVKTSSLGDVVHNLPVVSDIRRHYPQARVDWIVEEAYAPLVALHAAIGRVLPVALRRWRHRPFARDTWGEIARFRRRLRAERYERVIDSQGLAKSALLARIARGPRHGYDAASAREPLAACFYDARHRIAFETHAVERNRRLAAQALGYALEAAVDYGLRIAAAPAHDAAVVFLHASARAEKLWPEASWIVLGRELAARGFRCLLPWGDAIERARAERIAAAVPHATVTLPHPLDGMARLLAGARAAVGVDTGLTHLAAALGVPVVALYFGSDPRLNGVYGVARAVNLGAPGEPPSPAQALAALEALGAL